MNSDGPLSIEELIWCIAFGVTFGIGVAIAIEAVKTAWRIMRRVTK